MGMMGGLGAPAPAAPAPAPAPVAAAPAAPATPAVNLGDKNPRDLRLQYKGYLQTCVRQERTPAGPILDLIRMLAVEKPPQPNEEEEMKEILLLERRFGLTIHGGEANVQLGNPSDEELGVSSEKQGHTQCTHRLPTALSAQSPLTACHRLSLRREAGDV